MDVYYAWSLSCVVSRFFTGLSQVADASRISGDISSGGLHYSDGHGHIPEVCQVCMYNIYQPMIILSYRGS